jgi:hypothetical protein
MNEEKRGQILYCDIFDLIISFDEKIRILSFTGRASEKGVWASEALLKRWVKDCDTYIPDSRIPELKKRYEEAKWILDPADEALGHPKMVELRDQAIDDLRAGNVLSME